MQRKKKTLSLKNYSCCKWRKVLGLISLLAVLKQHARCNAIRWKSFQTNWFTVWKLDRCNICKSPESQAAVKNTQNLKSECRWRCTYQCNSSCSSSLLIFTLDMASSSNPDSSHYYAMVDKRKDDEICICFFFLHFACYWRKNTDTFTCTSVTGLLLTNCTDVIS